MILGDSDTLLSESDKAQLTEWAAEFSVDAETLGRWFFPDELLSVLEEADVTHVILVADPAFSALPYTSLRTSRGVVVEQPWTLSIATASLEIVRWTHREQLVQQTNPLAWFGPDPHVNESLGGEQELQTLNSLFVVNAHLEHSASIDNIEKAIATGHWVHFRGHGRWTGNILTSGPILHDGVLSRSSIENAKGTPSFVVTAACLTGFSEAIGSESLGSLVDYDRANCLGAVLTAWPIHGQFATKFMHYFYSALAQDLDVATAIKDASRHCYSDAPHPYLWAPFSVYGYWRAQKLLPRLRTK